MKMYGYYLLQIEQNPLCIKNTLQLFTGEYDFSACYLQAGSENTQKIACTKCEEIPTVFVP